MKALILVASAVVLSWANPASAGLLDGQMAGLLETPVELKTDFPSVSHTPSTPGLLDQSNMPFLLKAGEGGGAGAGGDSRGVIASILSFLVGFGVGHFVLGDGMAMTFLLLDVALIVGIIGLTAAAAAVVAGGGIPVFAFAIPLVSLAYTGVRIWEFVDCLLKSFNLMGGGARASVPAILPRGQEHTGFAALKPVAANGLAFRF